LNQNYAEFLGEYYDDPPFYVVCQMPLSNKGVGFVGVLGLKVGVWSTSKVCGGHVV